MNLKMINLDNVDNIETEEATKMSLIMPFIQQLGYNVFDINEVIPEYTADIGKRKGEKVDYAIKINNKIAIIIEAKDVNEQLHNHSKQLSRYFVNTEAKIGILTNGLEYWFYTDVDKENIMDSEPFFIFNLKNYKEKDLLQLKEFTKESFDETKLFGKAEELRLVNVIIDEIKEMMHNPSDELVKLLISNIYEGQKTQSVIQEYREYIKTAFNKTIDGELVKKLNKMFPDSDIRIEENIEQIKTEEKKKPEVETTENELMVYAYIKSMFPEENITWKDNLSYFNVLMDKKVTKWICRVYDKNQLKVEIHNEEENIIIELENPLDIFDFKDQLKQALDSRK